MVDRPGTRVLRRDGRLVVSGPDAVALRRVHIFGASGSGTSSLAAVLAAKHGHRHLDTDDFFWLPTDPPYEQPRPRAARLALLRDAGPVPVLGAVGLAVRVGTR
jgi:hypothetical protein